MNVNKKEEKNKIKLCKHSEQKIQNSKSNSFNFIRCGGGAKKLLKQPKSINPIIVILSECKQSPTRTTSTTFTNRDFRTDQTRKCDKTL